MSHEKHRYSAFVSYSHALDGRLAPTLQREIERFAKPWYRVRALRVFRDNASLSAQPDLWSGIENALSTSDWLILMASPEAARSPWVDREVSWWLANRSADRVLIVLTSGDLAWDQREPAADAAIPPALRGAIEVEPRWVDLRWLREAEHVDRSNPRLRECVADIAATIRGVPKDLLVGDHIRQHRRTMRLAWSASVTLALLLVLSVIGFSVAVVQRDEAVNQARIATARQLAANATANVDTRIDLAQLLSVEALRMERGPQTRSALFRSVTASPSLVRVHQLGDTTKVLAGAAGARIAVAGTETGRVVRWDLSNDTTSEITLGDAPVLDVAISADGGKIAATDGATAVLWDAAGDRGPVPIGGADVRQVAISPSGALAATLAHEDSLVSDIPAALRLMDGRTGEELRRTTTEKWSELALDEDVVMAINGGGHWARLSTRTLMTTERSADDRGKVPAGIRAVANSPTGNYFAVMKYENVWAIDNLDYDYDEIDFEGGTGYRGASMPIPGPEVLSISAGATYAAAAGGGSLYAARLVLDPGRERPQNAIHLSGQGRTDAIAFIGDGPELVSSAEGSLTQWNLAQTSRLSLRPTAELPSSPNVGGRPRFAVTPDGDRVAVTSDAGMDFDADRVEGPAIHDLSGQETRTTSLDAEYRDRVPLWDPDGNLLFLITAGGAADVLENGRVVGQWPARGEVAIIGAEFSRDGSQVVLLDETGGTQVRDAATGDVRASTRGVLDEDASAYYDNATVNGDTGTAAFIKFGQSFDGPVVVVDAEGGGSRTLPGEPAVLVRSSDDNLFVQHADGSLDIWDVTGTTKLRTITDRTGYAGGLAVVPGTGLLARLRGDGTVVISDFESGEVLGSVRLPPMTRSSITDPWNAATTLTATRDTGELVTATSGGRLAYWQLNEDAWIRAACAAAGRDLSAAEWGRFVASAPPPDLRCRR